MDFRTVFFDFHNVISKDLMYAGLEEEYARVREFVDREIFGPGSDLPDRWMRGEIKSADINRLIGAQLGIDCGLLAELQTESVKRMRLETRLLELSRRLRAEGISLPRWPPRTTAFRTGSTISSIPRSTVF